MRKPELPVLRLGLLGFAPRQQTLIESALNRTAASLRWRLGPLARSDALCINGAGVSLLPDRLLEVAPAEPPEAPVRLDLHTLERPFAVAIPVNERMAPSVHLFDATSPPSVRDMVQKFSDILRPRTMQFALASQLVAERLSLDTVFHVTVNGTLQAVVSRSHGIGVLAQADPLALEGASWARRPATAADIPGHFIQEGLTEVMWQYAMRTQRNLLDGSYRSRTIYWCRAPLLPQRIFDDAQLLVMRDLVVGPTNFTDLRQRTGLTDDRLARILAGLSIVGAITRDRALAQRAADDPSYEVDNSSLMDSRDAPETQTLMTDD